MSADTSDPAAFADDLVRMAAQWTRGNIGDDLALLIVEPVPAASA
jgi:hypothetical protein